MRTRREYNGFQIIADIAESPLGGYAASVILTRESPVRTECKFELPLYEKLATEHEASRAMRYAADIIDGLVPSIEPPKPAE